MSKESKSKDIPAPHEGLKPLNYKEQFSGRTVDSKFIDPCAAAKKASFACLAKNNYDRESCQEYFQAYRTCKQTWMDEQRLDRIKQFNGES